MERKYREGYLDFVINILAGILAEYESGYRTLRFEANTPAALAFSVLILWTSWTTRDAVAVRISPGNPNAVRVRRGKKICVCTHRCIDPADVRALAVAW